MRDGTQQRRRHRQRCPEGHGQRQRRGKIQFNAGHAAAKGGGAGLPCGGPFLGAWGAFVVGAALARLAVQLPAALAILTAPAEVPFGQGGQAFPSAVILSSGACTAPRKAAVRSALAIISASVLACVTGAGAPVASATPSHSATR